MKMTSWNFLIFIVYFFSIYLRCYAHSKGTAARYTPRYDTPTACFGSDPMQFPSSNLFAAAGDGIWDNGASCRREYLVRCISCCITPGVKNQTIQVKIVDYAPDVKSTPSSSGTTIVLSDEAFGVIADALADSINIEFQQKVSSAKIVPEVKTSLFSSSRLLREAEESVSESGPGY